ncbi:hypothetical protein BPOR_0287g00070 [Botrytis porri]|uniref:Uncharacterized protein n=1 Tax=Botrytis porri TaxID=87229 RepID=A0A4Z1KKQ0_9HELO|nr:hypothetical protein BPOR_0287g00070 [Botrytis porri]
MVKERRIYRTIPTTVPSESKRNEDNDASMKQSSRTKLPLGLETSVVETGIYGANVVSATIQVEV